MLDDFQIFENYMASEAFQKLSPQEREEFIASYQSFLEEEMDNALEKVKLHLQQKNISELFFRLYGHLEPEVIKVKNHEWFMTFGFHPLEQAD